MEETTTTEPIYFPEHKGSNWKTTIIAAIVAMIVLFICISIFTKKEKIKEQEYIKAQIDSINKVNLELKAKQDSLAESSKKFENVIIELDWKLQNVGQNKTIIKEFYHEKKEKTKKYTPGQLDNFFKDRYNY
jgi:mannitol-specific phosphotransferase system IIBC component